MAKKFNENYKFAGYSRVTDTEKGKTGIGQELELFGVFKREDMSEADYNKFIKAGYSWMMPLFFDAKGQKCKPWEKVTSRPGFFYKSFATKKERDASSKKARTALVKPEKKSTKKSNEAKKAVAKKVAKKAEPKTEQVTKGLIRVDGLLTNAVPLEQLTKKELLMLLNA